MISMQDNVKQPESYSEKKRRELRERCDAFLKSRCIVSPPCGFHVGAGWQPIVEKALDEMIVAGWDKRLAQVKQKFCKLRIYVDGFQTEKIRDIITNAENECNKSCEGCGIEVGESEPRTGIGLCETCKLLYVHKHE